MTTKNNEASNEITAQDVEKYLSQHKDFFLQQNNLLMELTLPHESGNAISLVERQVTLLRQRNEQMRERHTHLLENARENDRLFEKSKRLVLSLLEVNDLDDLIEALYYSFDKEFNIEYARIILFGNNQTVTTSAARVENLHKAKDVIGKRLSSARAVTGGISQPERAFIFDSDAKHVSSAAFSVLSHGGPIGLLAVGNSDPNYYHSGMGTMFLGYIAEVLNRLIPRLSNR